jgi:hypothetical protein
MKEENQTLSASEAVFGFCGWLTSRDKKTIMSSKNDAAVIVDLVAKFCQTNKFENPREGWEKILIHPKEE